MNHLYETKYRVVYRYYTDINSETHLEIDIESVLKLLETYDGGEDGWQHNDCRKKVLIISPQKWKNIALIPVCSTKIHKLIGVGAELVEPKELYDDEIDARIQVAYVCSKYLIEPSNVYNVTGGLINQKQYKELLKIFYEDFPEKYI